MSGTSIQDAGNKDWVAFAGSTHDAVLYRELDSFNYVKHKYFALKVMRKREKPVVRPLIPATLSDQIAFFCFCMWSPLQRQIFDVTHLYLTDHWKFAVVYNIFKTFPCAFLVYFLSKYSPLHHLYVSKMVPILHGTSWQVILCGFLKLAYISDTLVMIFDFTVTGIVKNVPWNRCARDYYNITNKTVYCYTLQTFYKHSRHPDVALDGNIFSLQGKHFQASQVLFIMLRNDLENGCFLLNFSDFFWCYYGVVWCLAIFFHRQLFKEYIWRIFRVLMYILCFIYLVTFLYIEISFIRGNLVRITRQPFEDTSELLRNSSMIPMVESTTAPPILHILNARKKSKVQGRRDSIIFSLTVFLFLILQTLTYMRLKDFCDAKAGTEVQLNILNSYPFYVLWPMFFRNFALGPLYNKCVYTTMLSLELITFIITYQCFVEVFSWEWTRIQRIYVSLTLSIAGLLFIYFTTAESRFLLNLCGQCIVTFYEVVAVLLFYPCGRLVEDMLFFYRTHIKKLTYVLSTIIILYVCFAYMCEEVFIVYFVYCHIHPVPLYIFLLFLLIPMLPVVVGSLYKMCWIIKKKKKCCSLFQPLPKWGPANHIIRQYRKHFDSRQFIHSLGSRYLSRHMLKTTQPKKYRIDVEYDRNKKEF